MPPTEFRPPEALLSRSSPPELPWFPPPQPCEGRVVTVVSPPASSSNRSAATPGCFAVLACSLSRTHPHPTSLETPCLAPLPPVDLAKAPLCRCHQSAMVVIISILLSHHSCHLPQLSPSMWALSLSLHPYDSMVTIVSVPPLPCIRRVLATSSAMSSIGLPPCCHVMLTWKHCPITSAPMHMWHALSSPTCPTPSQTINPEQCRQGSL